MSFTITRSVVGLATVALATAGLAACGSSSGSSTNSTPHTASTVNAPVPGQGQGQGGVDVAAIQKCLAAAGLSMPGMPSGLPSGMPSAMPTNMPSGIPGGAPRGMGGQLNNPKAQAALKACGITMPGAPAAN